MEQDQELESELSRLAKFATADISVALAALRLGHALISATRQQVVSDETASYKRWQRHQNLSSSFWTARGPLVFGFFQSGVAAEVSLFGHYPEIGDDLWVAVRDGCRESSVAALIIGFGPAELAVSVKAKFDTSQSQDWGWTDGNGTHIEKYDAVSRMFVRSSMTGRTSYRLHCGLDNLATVCAGSSCDLCQQTVINLSDGEEVSL